MINRTEIVAGFTCPASSKKLESYVDNPGLSGYAYMIIYCLINGE